MFHPPLAPLLFSRQCRPWLHTKHRIIMFLIKHTCESSNSFISNATSSDLFSRTSPQLPDLDPIERSIGLHCKRTAGAVWLWDLSLGEMIQWFWEGTAGVVLSPMSWEPQNLVPPVEPFREEVVVLYPLAILWAYLLEPAFAVGEETETGLVVGVGVLEIFVGLAAGDFGISNWVFVCILVHIWHFFL